jgi:NADH-quinone oxidoreductase subunit K
MAAVPMSHVLTLAGLLFVLGLAGLVARRNVLVMLVSVEIMLNAAGLAFIGAGARWARTDGQVMFMFILAVAAAEVAVGLALIIRLRQIQGTLDPDQARELADEPGRLDGSV